MWSSFVIPHPVPDDRVDDSQALRHRIAMLEVDAARNRAVLAASLDPLVTIDIRGVIQQVSDSVERVFGYAPHDLVGKNICMLLPEPHRSQHDGYLAHYQQTGITNILNRTREFEVVRKDGSRIFVDLSVSRADLPGGPVFTGSFRDVTERKQAVELLRDTERRFHAIFDGSYQYVGLLRPDGTVLEVNQAALDAAGLTLEDVIGKPFWDTRWWWLSSAAQDNVRDAIQAAARGEFVRFEVQIHGRGDEPIDIDFSIKPVRDDEGRIVLLIPEGRNITELKRAQRAETSTLRALATVGESAAVLAHEIKNPITAVNVALRAVAGQLGVDERVVLEDLVARMQRLEQLMRGTLSFAKPLELKRAPCEATDFFQSVVASVRLQIVQSGSDVKFEIPEGNLRFSADARLLEEVFGNLILNAIEATASGAKIVLSARLVGREAVELSIEDDGPGIPADQRGAIFKPFMTTKKTGTGLGLAICKKIIEAHGGSIEVGSSRSGGARFTTSLGEARIH